MADFDQRGGGQLVSSGLMPEIDTKLYKLGHLAMRPNRGYFWGLKAGNKGAGAKPPPPFAVYSGSWCGGEDPTVCIASCLCAVLVYSGCGCCYLAVTVPFFEWNDVFGLRIASPLSRATAWMVRQRVCGCLSRN